MSRFKRTRKSYPNTAEGRRAVLEVLRSGRKVERIFMADQIDLGPQLKEIVLKAETMNCYVEAIPRRELDRISRTKKHQGVIAVVADARYVPVEDLIFKADELDEIPLIVLLDQIQDPQNLGAIARVLDACGGHGLVIPERHAVGITPGSLRASAGALEHVLVSRVVSIKKTVVYFRQIGINILGLDHTSELSYVESKLTGPTALILGSESNGISSDVKSLCDELISIPMKGKVESLNVAVSAGVVLYETMRQRMSVSMDK